LLVDRVTKPLIAAREPRVSAGTILPLAASCGVIVANMYYAQPLAGRCADGRARPP
jgi:hypothetical protein